MSTSSKSKSASYELTETHCRSGRRHPSGHQPCPGRSISHHGNPSPSTINFGDYVKVFSRSADAWVIGEVVELDRDMLRVEYEANGYWCRKHLSLHHAHLILPIKGVKSLSSADVEEFDPGAVLPPHSEGKSVQIAGWGKRYPKGRMFEGTITHQDDDVIKVSMQDTRTQKFSPDFLNSLLVPKVMYAVSGEQLSADLQGVDTVNEVKQRIGRNLMLDDCRRVKVCANNESLSDHVAINPCINYTVYIVPSGGAEAELEAKAGHPDSSEKNNESTLSSYFIARSQGQHAEIPLGYCSGYGVLQHISTGVTIMNPPILQSTDDTEQRLVLYHYTNEANFNKIVGNKHIRHLRASYAERAHFGDAVYASIKGPADFGTKDAILLNNYTNKVDPTEQERQIQDWREKGVVDFCVPVIVPQRVAVNVRTHKTKEMQHVGCTVRHNEPIREGRDIWCIVIREDGEAEAGHAVEDFEAVYQHLDHSDFNVRLDAVERLGEKVAAGDRRATQAVVRSLNDPDPQVQVAAVWAVACAHSIKTQDAIRMLDKLLVGNIGHYLKSNIHDALDFLHQ